MNARRNDAKVLAVVIALLVVLVLCLYAFAGELSVYGGSPGSFDVEGSASISALAPAPGHASMYVKFDGVDGEAQDKDHKNWSDILTFSQGQLTSTAGAGSTRLRDECVFEDVVLVKEIDKASPKLAEAVCRSRVFPKVEIHVAGWYGAGEVTYYAYEFKNVQITSYRVDGSTDGPPAEEVAFNFEEITATYSEMDELGRPKGNVEYSWRVEEGLLF